MRVARLCDAAGCEMCGGRSMVAVEFVGRGPQPVRTVVCPLHVDGSELRAVVERVYPPTPPRGDAA